MNELSNELINLHEADATWIIDAAFATDKTFIQKQIYPRNELFLMKPAVERLLRVQHQLQAQELSLKIWDAYRPPALQKILWERIQDDRYVANPKNGSRHNRGCAVDVTLVDQEHIDVPMPTPYLDFSERAHRDYMDLPERNIANRRLLEEVMVSEGFLPLHEEWWHFDAPEWKNYPVLDVNPYNDSYLPVDVQK